MTTAERDRLLAQIKAAIVCEPVLRKLGKKPARKGAVKFALKTYVDLTKLPAPPADFGHENLVLDWKMLGNNLVGDCVLAGAAHETILWNKEANRDVPFDDTSVLSDFSALTGYDPAQTDANGYNPTDQGTDMQQAASYRRTTGIVDANGVRHQILAYLALEPGNLEQLYAAMYVFGAVGIGIRFPESAMDQLDAGLPWSVVQGSNVSGGHYIPGVAKRDGKIYVVTWGQLQAMTPEFYQAYCDEAVVYLTSENLVEGKTNDGFDLATLEKDLAALRPQPIQP